MVEDQELGVNPLPSSPRNRAAPSGLVGRQLPRKSSNEENLLSDDEKLGHSQPVHPSGLPLGVRKRADSIRQVSEYINQQNSYPAGTGSMNMDFKLEDELF